jgi:nicotinate-nucleotide--dimethylbenzimidazole phosphoribosyltransferase
MVDGMAACAALMVASRIAPAVTDYCVFCRSTPHEGLDQALHSFQATALLDLGLDTMDGTGACLVWPMVQSACALLADLSPEEAAMSRPTPLETSSPAPAAPNPPPPDDEEPTVPGKLP